MGVGERVGDVREPRLWGDVEGTEALLLGRNTFPARTSESELGLEFGSVRDRCRVRVVVRVTVRVRVSVKVRVRSRVRSRVKVGVRVRVRVDVRVRITVRVRDKVRIRITVRVRVRVRETHNPYGALSVASSDQFPVQSFLSIAQT